jgi:AcrR family transcriptional regulator
VAGSPETVDRILDGALRALARHGSKRLAMSDICEEAAVSRGTLYRYFRNKDEILAAISDHVEQGYELALARAIEDEPALDQRVRVVLRAIFTYAHASLAPRVLLQADAAFTLHRLTEDFPFFVRVTKKALAPVLDGSRVVKSGINATFIVEVFQWIALGAHLVPSPHADQLPDVLADLWELASGG